MKILWSSNAPWAGTGYGQTTARFIPRIRDLGHDLACFAFYGLHGSPLEWEGFTVYPGGTDSWGNDVLTAYALHHMEGDRNSGWLILLQDVWTLKSETLKDLHVAAWAPVDHSPCPPAVVEFFTRTGAVPLSMSKHGHQMFQDAGLRPIYVPHGIDTKLFTPRPDLRAQARTALGIPQDAYCFGMVAANQSGIISRKAYPEVFEAFGIFQRKHPSAVLYVHAAKTKMYGGLQLERLAENLDIPPESIIYVDQFAYTLGEITTADMPGVYSAIDVLVNPAYGEGFGMPIIEAQACGVPVILADNTAMHELLGGGWMVPSYKFWDESQLSWWGRIHVPELVSAMEKAYQSGSKPGKLARGFAEDYDADDITEKYWKPALKTMEEMLQTPKAEPVDLAAL